MRSGSLLATVLLTLVALAHLARLAFQVEVLADGTPIPQWVSVLGVAIPGTVAWMLWRETRAGKSGPSR